MKDLVLTTLTRDELQALVIDSVKVCLKHYAPQPKPRQPDDEPGEAGQTYVSKRQAARLLDCSPSTVDNAARAGKLRRHYVGKSVRFLRSEVLGLAKATTNHKQKSFNNER